jgi:hypothetical protein
MQNKPMVRLFGLFVVVIALVGPSGFGALRSSNPETRTFGPADQGAQDETGYYATICGGQGNTAAAAHATVCGGLYNTASVEQATVSGGTENTASATRATIGGGYGNSASRLDATIGGGGGNTASGSHATVGGGSRNAASGRDSTVSGGAYNSAVNTNTTVGGGSENAATGFDATVGGGAGNTASGAHATVAGGLGNQGTQIYATVGGGYSNAADGAYSTVPGGFLNQAAGDHSFAAGHRASVETAHPGVFLFADANDFDFHSEAANEFAVRATGGIRFVTATDDRGNPTAGVQLPPGSGSWSSLSDRGVKANVSPVDEDQVLGLLADLPISVWNYTGQDPSIRHIGPTSQDFRAAFGLGEDDQHISTVDADGVALAAIQGLYQLVQEQDSLIKAQQGQIAALEARLAALEQAQ